MVLENASASASCFLEADRQARTNRTRKTKKKLVLQMT